jgi:hypothetical protein
MSESQARSGTQPHGGAAGIGAATIMQLPVPDHLAPYYAGNLLVPGTFEPHRGGGLCVRIEDLAAGNADSFLDQHGLSDAADWPRGEYFYGLRFYAAAPALYEVSFGGRTPVGAQQTGTHRVLPAPFVGTGYTNYTERAVPEYWMLLTELSVGTELWRVDSAANQERVAVYGGRYAGWRPEPGVEQFGQYVWTPPPVPLPTSVRRGLYVVVQGVEYEAEFGPHAGEVTLYRRAEDGKLQAMRLPIEQCDAVIHVRLLCTWRGAQFEALAADADTVALNYLGENYQEAAELGLPEIGYRIWRTVVPRMEVAEYALEERPVGAA